MNMDDTRRVPAPQATVWAALNDPEILKSCIPGCERLDMTSPTEMNGVVVVKIGPIKAQFSGKVTLSDLDPPNGYRISGEGSGGVAGFAKGGATVRLSPDGPDATLLHYVVDAQVGGKLAQLGSRLIDSTAKKLAVDFFQAFATAASVAQAPAAAPAAARATAASSAPAVATPAAPIAVASPRPGALARPTLPVAAPFMPETARAAPAPAFSPPPAAPPAPPLAPVVPAPPPPARTPDGWLSRFVVAVRRLFGLERAAQSS